MRLNKTLTEAIIQQLVIRNDFCLLALDWNSCSLTLTFIYVQGASEKVLPGLISFTHILPLRGPFTHIRQCLMEGYWASVSRWGGGEANAILSK